MFYPKKFKERVKKVYPNWEELHRALDRGDPLVGDYLYSHFCFGIPCNVILAATSLEALQSKVREQEEKNNLYKDWVELRNEWYDNSKNG